jgi:hypothetical protein
VLHLVSLIFAGKAGAYSSEAPFRCSTPGSAPGLTHKYYTRQEKLARDKHSSLLQKSVNYGRKKFYGKGPCLSGTSKITTVITLFGSRVIGQSLT